MSGTMSRSYRLSGTLSRSYNNKENSIKCTMLGNVGRSILAGLPVLLGGVLGLFPAKSGKFLGPTLTNSTFQSSKQKGPVSDTTSQSTCRKWRELINTKS